MAYSDFTLARFKKAFHLLVEEQVDLFAAAEPVAPSDFLDRTLAETVELALAINTEKARYELIIAPLLLEVRRR